MQEGGSREAQKQQRGERQREEAMREETTYSAEEGVAEKHTWTDKSDRQMDTEGGEEMGTSQSFSTHKKGHMTDIYLTDSNEEAIVDVLKDHKELYDKTNQHFNDKARKECLWRRFTNSCQLSVKLCKTWFKSKRTCYGKLMQFKSQQAPKEMTERQNWIQDKFNFLKTHVRHK